MKKGDFTTLGATAHSDEEREENDFYATDPKALELFLDQTGIELRNVWECACGQGHLAEVLKQRGLLGRASDLIDRGYGQVESNFYYYSDVWDGDILTNPPYGDAMKFCKLALDCVDEGGKVIMSILNDMGNTPLVKLKNPFGDNYAQVYLKMEEFWKGR